MPDERDKYDVLHGGWEAPASEVAQARARGVPAKGVAPGGGVLGFARVALLATLLSVSARNPRLRKGVLFSSRLSTFVNGVSSSVAPVAVGYLLDFSDVADVNPFVPSDYGWTEDYIIGGGSKVAAGVWVAVTAALSQHTMHADNESLDLNGLTDVFVEGSIAGLDGSESAALFLSADYNPGAWRTLGFSSGDTPTGYRVVFNTTGYTVLREVNGSSTVLLSRNAAISIGDKIALRATVEEARVVITLYVDDVAIDTVDDTHAGRITDFRTVGVGVASRGTGVADQGAFAWIDAGEWK